MGFRLQSENRRTKLGNCTRQAYTLHGVTVLKGNKVTQVAGHYAYVPPA